MRPSTDTLDERLAALSRALADRTPPATVDRAIAAAIERSGRGTAVAAARPFERWLSWPIALAASIALIGVLLRESPPELPAPAGRLAAASTKFLPVVPQAEIARSTDAWVVPARMPRMALAGLGLPVDPALASETIDAELLVRSDGAVLALRFVR